MKLKLPYLLLILGLSGSLYGADSLTEQSDEGWDDDWSEDSWDEPRGQADWHGFVEAGVGRRFHYDPTTRRDETLEEIRLQLETQGYHGDNSYALKGDLYFDGVEEGARVDIREASYSMTVTDNWDLKLGQQVLTWGTGDLLFLNDLFAKDWQSYFSGRDTEYLKAPSAAVRASYFGDSANLDLVWIPDFTPDRYINGERFAYFSPQLGQPVDQRIDAEEPANGIDNSEWAARLYGTVSGTEWAVYGYRGFQPQPNALNDQGEPVFSRLSVVGASLRGNVGQGLANVEIAWYLGEDADGDDPLQPNDQVRLLLGYERELLPKLTLGLQYYAEQTLDYGELEQVSASPYNPHEYRYLYTTRLSYRMWQDNLTWSLFTYYSPSDEDRFIRPSVSYRFNDNLSATLGANLFHGKRAHTFFGQFEEASSVYGRIRYAF